MTKPIVLLLLFCLALPVASFAADLASTAQSLSAQTLSTAHESVVKESAEDSAKRWGLSVAEWAKYEEIMKGEGRYNWRDADPITVLGIYAESDEERERYAERLAVQEYNLQKRFLALNAAYLKAARRLVGDEPLIDIDDFNRFYDRASLGDARSTLDTDNFASAMGDRYVLFITPGCPGCDEHFREIRKHQKFGTSLDVYFVGVGNNEILQWARDMKIDPAVVRGNEVTLNPDTGAYARYNHPPLPAAFYYDKSAGRVTPLPLK